MKTIIILLFCPLSVFCQICDYDSTNLELSLQSDTINSLEILKYTLSFSNQSNKGKTLISPWNDAFELPVLEYQNKNDSLWKKLPLSDTGYGSYSSESKHRRSKIKLEKDSSITINLSWTAIPFINLDDRLPEIPKRRKLLNDWKKINWNHFFSQTGEYLIRAKITNCQDQDLNLVSNEVILIVEGYEGIDKNAEIWLRENCPHAAFVYLPMLFRGRSFSSYNINVDTNFNIEEHLLEFIKLFPNSTFTSYVKLYLARWYLEGFEYVMRPGYGVVEDRLILTTVTPYRIKESKLLFNEILQYAQEANDDYLEKTAQRGLNIIFQTHIDGELCVV